MITESKDEPLPVQPEPEPEPAPAPIQPEPVVPVNAEPVPAKPPPSAGDLLVDLLGPLMIEGPPAPPGPQVPPSGPHIPPSGPAAPVAAVPEQNLNQGLDLGQELAGALAITTLEDQTNSVQVSFLRQQLFFIVLCDWVIWFGQTDKIYDNI